MPLSLLRIRNAFASMSSRWSAGDGWSEAFDSENGCRRGQLGKVLRGRMVLSDVQYGVLELRLEIAGA